MHWSNLTAPDARTPRDFYGSETPFTNSTLSAAELNVMTSFCGFIQSNGSGYGICKFCQGNSTGSIGPGWREHRHPGSRTQQQRRLPQRLGRRSAVVDESRRSIVGGAFFVGLVLLISLVTVLVLARRTQRLPECIKCDNPSVRASHPSGIDGLLRLVFLYPHRCGHCQRRYHCFRARNPMQEEF